MLVAPEEGAGEGFRENLAAVVEKVLKIHEGARDG